MVCVCLLVQALLRISTAWEPVEHKQSGWSSLTAAASLKYTCMRALANHHTLSNMEALHPCCLRDGKQVQLIDWYIDAMPDVALGLLRISKPSLRLRRWR